ncbi:MAG: invasion associated locus B family protein [Pseudomonadota bacterium]
MRFLRVIGGSAMAVALAVAMTASLAPGAAWAQAQSRVDVQKDWAVFVAGEGAEKVCWIVSVPESSAATRDGKPVTVNRGDIFLMVAVRPGQNVKNQVSFIAGYPFQPGSKVDVTVGPRKQEMFTDGENAWLPSSAEDDTAVQRFRAGAKAQVRGLSSRGTTTVDTFSLSGFTAAIRSASGRCS